jgi:transposase InsO family protein
VTLQTESSPGEGAKESIRVAEWEIWSNGRPTRTQARNAIFEFIEVFYNRLRIHSTLECLPPAEYESRRTRLDVGTKEAA